MKKIPSFTIDHKYVPNMDIDAAFAAIMQIAVRRQFRRGVLSEDGIYNLLEENDALRKRLRQYSE